MRVVDISIDRPVFAGMVVVSLVVLGLVSLGRTELRLEPEIDFPYAYVVTELRGASPETVEREVTDVLEEALNPIEGIKSLSSTSTQGLSRVFIEFGIDYDVDVKAQEVRDKVALARPDLPLDVESPVVQKFDFDSIGFMTIVLGGNLGPKELADFAEHEAKERLERIPGVGGVAIEGAREREVRIWLDPLRLTGYGLSIDDVAGTLRIENAEFASGRLEGAEQEWSVTTQGKARTVAEFGEMIVAERDGRVIRLRDVAVVEDGLAEQKTVARFNGKPGVALEIVQQSGSDLVAATRLIRKELIEIEALAPPGIEMTIARDYARIIEDQVSTVLFDMVLAAGLVFVVVLVFLRNYRSTLIASLAIPTSVISTFTFLYWLDISLNNMTLMALSLAVGLVIDDAIVVLEGIFRKVEQGHDSVTAARLGANEVGLAVLSTTAAVCAVFVPIRFMTSTMGRYFYEFGVTVTAAVGVSMIVAFTLTPMLASKYLRQTPKEGAFFEFCERGLRWLETRYERLLEASIRRRRITVVFTLAVVFGGCWVQTTLPVDYFTQDDLSEARVSIDMPVGTPLAVTDRVMRIVEEAVAEHEYVRGIYASAGSVQQHEPNEARIDVLLIPKKERTHPIDDTFVELRLIAAEAAPEVEDLSVGHPSYASSSGDEMVDLEYDLRGPNLEQLSTYAAQLTALMRAHPGFADVSTSHETGRPQITLDVDRGRAAELGISATSLGRTLRTLLAGEKVGSFEDMGHRYDVRVQVLPEYRDDPSKLDLIRVRSIRGELVPITNAAHIRSEDGPVEIRRSERSRVIEVRANTQGEFSLEQAELAVEAWGRELGIVSPNALVAGGQSESRAEAAADIGLALGLGMLAIYIILASLFNSLTQPLTIMISAPLSFLGGFLALKLAGQSLDIMSNMGLLVLMGLVMKNGILLVDYITQLRDEGVPRDEAIVRAGPVRMRPVLMTSAALIFGLLPMALSNATGAEFRAPMAWIVIGGLATSTALTLVVVPIMYTLIDSATEGVKGGVRSLFGRAKPELAKPDVLEV
jgi:HAE1 family hydrophobic/amphiphilic exporter-1